jgi:hypothetical protein
MPIPNTLPTVAAVPADTLRGQRIIFAFSTDGGTTQKNFRAKVADISSSVQKVQRKVPDANGRLVADRTDVIEVTKTMKLTFDEFHTDLMSTFINPVTADGVAMIWIKDKSDASNVAFLKSNQFACTVTHEGSIAINAENFSETELTVDVNDTLTLTRAASTA